MKCPIKFFRYPFEGGEKCDPECALLVRDLQYVNADGVLVERLVCGFVDPNQSTVNAVVREVNQ